MLAQAHSESIQTTALAFFVPVAVAYAVSALAALWCQRRWRGAWPQHDTLPPPRPWREVAYGFVAAAAVLGLGQLWQHGVLRWSWSGAPAYLDFAVQQAVIWSPIPVLLLWRRQPGLTVWLQGRGALARALAGAAIAALSVTVFLALRGELERWPTILAQAVTPRSLGHALPVFMEGVGLAMLFVRLRWAMGLWPAALLPALLFALAHVPGELAAQHAAGHVAAFFAFNTAVATVLLVLIARTRDIVWLGVVHYAMDLAIAAF